VSAEIRLLQTVGCSLRAVTTSREGPESDVLNAPDRVLPFDGSRPKGLPKPLDGSTYLESLAAIDRQASELGFGSRYGEIREWYDGQRRSGVSEQVLDRVWYLHRWVWATRAEAAYEVGFAAGSRWLRGETGERLVDMRVTPADPARDLATAPGTRAESNAEATARSRRNRLAELKRVFEVAHGPLTGETKAAEIWIAGVGAVTKRRWNEAGIATLADAAARTQDEIGAIKGLSLSKVWALEEWVNAAGLSLRAEAPEQAKKAADQGARPPA
jgi:hypothetical protein